ncbi:sugar phosphate nucleotidyltransferase [Novipirellula aureliae]|nr:sugar phosphate nucleotidyltransferase [Novipirellula aureliae]
MSDKSMQSYDEPCAVILAAGKGTRMKSDLPKVLCPVVGRAMIHFVLDSLEKAGIKRQIVVVGYEAEAVKQELANREGQIEFVMQNEQLGTGHAVQMCRDALQLQTGPTMVVAGDSPLIQPTSVKKVVDRFNDTKPALLLATLEKEDPTGLGRIVRDESGQFLEIVEEKDATEDQRKIREVNMSTYLFNTPDLLDALSNLRNQNSQKEYYLTDCPRWLREAGRAVEAIVALQPCESLSINNPEELQLVDQKMRSMGYT